MSFADAKVAGLSIGLAAGPGKRGDAALRGACVRGVSAAAGVVVPSMVRSMLLLLGCGLGIAAEVADLAPRGVWEVPAAPLWGLSIAPLRGLSMVAEEAVFCLCRASEVSIGAAFRERCRVLILGATGAGGWLLMLVLRWVIGAAFVAPRRGDLLLGKGMLMPEWASVGALACDGCALSA